MESLITGIGGDGHATPGGDRLVEVAGRAVSEPYQDHRVLESGRVRMVCRVPARRLAAQVWSEGSAHSEPTACVYVLGWCYRIGSGAEALEPDDNRRFVERHRQGLPPVRRRLQRQLCRGRLRHAVRSGVGATRSLGDEYRLFLGIRPVHGGE